MHHLCLSSQGIIASIARDGFGLPPTLFLNLSGERAPKSEANFFDWFEPIQLHEELLERVGRPDCTTLVSLLHPQKSGWVL